MNKGTSWALLGVGSALMIGGGLYFRSTSAPASPEAPPAPAEAPVGTVLPSPSGSIAIADADLPVVTVWKSPTCGCCSMWVEHMKEAGFKVDVRDVADVTPYKNEHGVDPKHASCHTAMVGGYVIEGHVPADDIKRLLSERPQLVGVAAPGMPAGSPGMEVSGQAARYDVIAFDKAGKTSVWAAHR